MWPARATHLRAMRCTVPAPSTRPRTLVGTGATLIQQHACVQWTKARPRALTNMARYTLQLETHMSAGTSEGLTMVWRLFDGRYGRPGWQLCGRLGWPRDAWADELLPSGAQVRWRLVWRGPTVEAGPGTAANRRLDQRKHRPLFPAYSSTRIGGTSARSLLCNGRGGAAPVALARRARVPAGCWARHLHQIACKQGK